MKRIFYDGVDSRDKAKISEATIYEEDDEVGGESQGDNRWRASAARRLDRDEVMGTDRQKVCVARRPTEPVA